MFDIVGFISSFFSGGSSKRKSEPRISSPTGSEAERVHRATYKGIEHDAALRRAAPSAPSGSEPSGGSKTSKPATQAKKEQANKEFRKLISQGKSPEEAARIIEQKYGARVEVRKARAEVKAPAASSSKPKTSPPKSTGGASRTSSKTSGAPAGIAHDAALRRAASPSSTRTQTRTSTPSKPATSSKPAASRSRPTKVSYTVSAPTITHRTRHRTRHPAQKPEPKPQPKPQTTPATQAKPQTTQAPSRKEQADKEFRRLIAQGKSPGEAARIIEQKYGGKVTLQEYRFEQEELVKPPRATEEEWKRIEEFRKGKMPYGAEDEIRALKEQGVKLTQMEEQMIKLEERKFQERVEVKKSLEKTKPFSLERLKVGIEAEKKALVAGVEGTLLGFGYLGHKLITNPAEGAKEAIIGTGMWFASLPSRTLKALQGDPYEAGLIVGEVLTAEVAGRATAKGAGLAKAGALKLAEPAGVAFRRIAEKSKIAVEVGKLKVQDVGWKVTEPLYQKGILRPKLELVEEKPLSQVLLEAARTYRKYPELIDLELLEKRVQEGKFSQEKFEKIKKLAEEKEVERQARDVVLRNIAREGLKDIEPELKALHSEYMRHPELIDFEWLKERVGEGKFSQEKFERLKGLAEEKEVEKLARHAVLRNLAREELKGAESELRAFHESYMRYPELIDFKWLEERVAEGKLSPEKIEKLKKYAEEKEVEKLARATVLRNIAAEQWKGLAKDIELLMEYKQAMIDIKLGISRLRGEIRPLSRWEIATIESRMAEKKLIENPQLLLEYKKAMKDIELGISNLKGEIRPLSRTDIALIESKLAEERLKRLTPKQLAELKKLAEDLGWAEEIRLERQEWLKNTRIIDLSESGELAKIETQYRGKRSFRVESEVEAEKLPERLWEKFEKEGLEFKEIGKIDLRRTEIKKMGEKGDLSRELRKRWEQREKEFAKLEKEGKTRITKGRQSQIQILKEEVKEEVKTEKIRQKEKLREELKDLKKLREEIKLANKFDVGSKVPVFFDTKSVFSSLEHVSKRVFFKQLNKLEMGIGQGIGQEFKLDTGELEKVAEGLKIKISTIGQIARLGEGQKFALKEAQRLRSRVEQRQVKILEGGDIEIPKFRLGKEEKRKKSGRKSGRHKIKIKNPVLRFEDVLKVEGKKYVKKGRTGKKSKSGGKRKKK